MAALESELRKVLKGPERVRVAEPLARHTTFRIGGPAEYFLMVTTAAELAAVLGVLADAGVSMRMLGNGSNLLVADEGVQGAVLLLAGELASYHTAGYQVTAGGGMNLPKLAQQVSKQGLAGLTFACAIPGTIGAGLIINAGAHGGDMSQIVSAAEVFWLDGRQERLDPAAIGFGYRTTSLQGLPLVVASVTMTLTAGQPELLEAEIRRHLEHRRLTQPLQLPNAGSIFKNPPGGYAGRLIESAGCKGWREQDAQVSERHANFIVNLGQATFRDVVQLMLRVRDQVEAVHGIRMEPEVRIWGHSPFAPEVCGL